MNISDRLKSLKTEPRKRRWLIYYGVLAVAIPFIVGIWFLSIRSSLESIALNPNAPLTREALGPKFMRLTGEFFGKVQTGINNLFRSLADAVNSLDWQTRLGSIWLKIQGRPIIQELPPGTAIPLPLGNSSQN